MENSVIKAIETRRSVRSFSQKAIPEELLDAVLEAGTYAPTGGGRQSRAKIPTLTTGHP